MTGLHYTDFLSLHYIAYGSTSCNYGTKQNYCWLPCYTYSRAIYLSLPPFLSHYNRTLPLFLLYSSSNLRLPTFITSRMPQSGKLPVLNLLTGPKSGFSPCRGNSLHRFTSNLTGLTGTWVRWAVQNFTSIARGGWECGPKISKISTFGKESPCRGDSLDRFRKFLGAFMRLTILH